MKPTKKELVAKIDYIIEHYEALEALDAMPPERIQHALRCWREIKKNIEAIDK